MLHQYLKYKLELNYFLTYKLVYLPKQIVLLHSGQKNLS